MRTIVTPMDMSGMPDIVKSSVPSSSKRRRLTVIWALAKVAGPAIAAFLALVISSLTLWDQHRASIVDSTAASVAAVAVREAYAAKVSYWTVGNGDGTQIVVENRGDQPIQKVRVILESRSDKTSFGTAFVGLGRIPSCSTMTADVLDAARLYLVGYSPRGPLFGPSFGVPVVGFPLTHSLVIAKRRVQRLQNADQFRVRIDSLVFTDVNGWQWWRKNSTFLRGPSVGDIDSGLSYETVMPVREEIRQTGCS